MLAVDLTELVDTITKITLNGNDITIAENDKLFFKETNDKWEKVAAPSLSQKGPHRNGGFKDAFRNNVVFYLCNQRDTSGKQMVLS